MPSFFITSSGTGIGKTLVTAALAWQLRAGGKKVTALKPVMSGYDPGDLQNDAAEILKACGVAPTAAAVEAISPWRYTQPLAPNMAAAKEGREPVDLAELVNFCRSREGDYTLVEGIGGVMSPVNDHHTVLDWMAALGWPVVLVCGSYLGAISHALTAVEVLRAKPLAIRALPVSESEGGAVSLQDTAATLEKFLRVSIPVVHIPRIAARDELWKHAPDISGICT